MKTTACLSLGCMNKRFFLSIVLALLSGAAFSQIELGVKLGANASRSIFENAEYNRYTNSKFKIGFQGGIVAIFENPDNDKYALQTELYYAKIGRKVESDNFFESNNNNYGFTTNVAEYSYINLPVMFRMRFDAKGFDWYLVAGPQLSYWLGGKGAMHVLDASRENKIDIYNYKINFDEPKAELEYMDVHDANRIQVGLTVGLGWHYELNDADRLAAGIRYYFGHSNMGIFDGGEIGGGSGRFDNFESVNHSLELSVFYTFDIYMKTRAIRKKNY